jgi:hypothetical protein
MLRPIYNASIQHEPRRSITWRWNANFSVKSVCTMCNNPDIILTHFRDIWTTKHPRKSSASYGFYSTTSSTQQTTCTKRIDNQLKHAPYAQQAPPKQHSTFFTHARLLWTYTHEQEIIGYRDSRQLYQHGRKPA